MLRSLIHYWRIHLAVVLGAAVATSVLTGALLVGDSVQGSLRDLTLGRLGKVARAVVSARYVREELASDLGGRTGHRVAPMIALTATLQVAETGVRANKVSLYGVDERFGAFFERMPVEAGPSSRLRVLHPNAALRRTLDAEPGQALLLTVETRADIPREFLFGREAAEDRITQRRVRMGSVVEDDAGGRFSFEPNQSLPLVAFVDLNALQDLVGARGRVNRILVGGDIGEDALVAALGRSVTLSDYGLKIGQTDGVVSLESEQFLLSALAAEAARAVADTLEIPATGVFTYLANAITTSNGSVPYSTVSAIGPWSGRSPPSQLVAATGDALPLPTGDDVVVNRHAAERLGAAIGDSLTLRFYEVETGESYAERDVRLRLGSVAALTGLAADRSLTPTFPGLQAADNMADWDAPFPVDYGRITAADEAYWDAYEATPKAFLSLEKGRSLWSSRFGDLSSVRFHTEDGGVTADSVGATLLARLSPEGQGITVLPLRERGLSAARGATDFRGLFFGFSMFLVVAGLAMISQLFKLGIQGRRHEIGLLKAVGFRVNTVRKRLIAEGVVLAAVGAFLGVAGAALYAKVMVHGLSTWWVEAVGTRLLRFHASPLTIIAGGVGSVLLIVLILWRSIGTASRASAIGLIKERGAGETDAFRPGRARAVGLGAGALAGVLTVVALVGPEAWRVGLFFGVAAAALAGLLAVVRLGAQGWRGDRAGTPGLAFAQLSRFPGRTTSSITLIAMAVFVLVAVGLNRHETVAQGEAPPGSGGFRWIAESAIPLSQDLNDRSTLVDNGFTREEIDRIGHWDVHAFRLKPGEDASCLNLHRPGQPRILGVGQRTIERNGFSFHSVVDGVGGENPWRGLNLDLPEGVVPAIGDYNSVRWILHSGLGQEIVVQDAFGRPLRLRFVALLQGSVLQSEVMISESRFVEYFPSIAGDAFFLIDSDPEAEDVAGLLETKLDDFGMDVTTARFRLARYRAVENTYMATFQMIGGLGTVLGTLGVAVLMMRNAAERRGELAAMRAIGYSRRRLKRLLSTETAVLIVLGVGIGCVAGLVATLPVLVARGAAVPWQDVALSVLAVVLAGIVSGRITAALALRAPIVETLKQER